VDRNLAIATGSAHNAVDDETKEEDAKDDSRVGNLGSIEDPPGFV
jgi:hypothetical protein